MTRPQSCTARYFSTRTRPSSASTSTSTKCAPNVLRTLPPSTVGLGAAEATSVLSPLGNPFSAILRFNSRAASTTAVPVIIVVRLPDSPTEYGQRSVSPQTTSTLDSGTSKASAAIRPIVVFAPAPTSVTPTCTLYSPLAFTSITALLRPKPDRNARNEKPAPRFTGPESEPGCGRQRFFQSNAVMPR